MAPAECDVFMSSAEYANPVPSAGETSYLAHQAPRHPLRRTVFGVPTATAESEGEEIEARQDGGATNGEVGRAAAVVLAVTLEQAEAGMEAWMEADEWGARQLAAYLANLFRTVNTRARATTEGPKGQETAAPASRRGRENTEPSAIKAKASGIRKGRR
ncbi:hypothetical protein B0H17DRAFT_1205091 [Mycena rosella]|uniref:Uncharacterized protein n=1 Tax=Mycena rosella TaxID=1033263 RepID=A0AAD7D8K7_MYCRO|nr:hypothetical protein B0H17DRAFT_1205091 [Mycena rosella]